MNLPFKNLKDIKPPNGSEIWFIHPDSILGSGGFEFAEVCYVWDSHAGGTIPFDGYPAPEPYIHQGIEYPYKVCYEIGEFILEGDEDFWWIGAEEVERILKECSFDSDSYLQTR